MADQRPQESQTPPIRGGVIEISIKNYWVRFEACRTEEEAAEVPERILEGIGWGDADIVTGVVEFDEPDEHEGGHDD